MDVLNTLSGELQATPHERCGVMSRTADTNNCDVCPANETCQTDRGQPTCNSLSRIDNKPITLKTLLEVKARNNGMCVF